MSGPPQAPQALIVLVSNGPGELSTWVRPLAHHLHRRLALQPLAPESGLALRLVLVPCPNATGREPCVAADWGVFERVLPASRFWRLLLRPGRYGFWPQRGVVVFLGGDQFWTVLLSARLGYRHLTYAEWVARWPRWNDRIALMGAAASSRLAARWRRRAVVVGDLMADLSASARADAPLPPGGPWVALLPGSKRAKLQVGVPFLLETADRLAALQPGCRFLLPLAPTIGVADLQAYAGPANPVARQYAAGVPEHRDGNLQTAAGTTIRLLQEHPAHDALSQCSLALTTVGANTAELGALAVPMIVLVPTQHLQVMQAWDGWLGLVARLPLLRRLLGVALTAWRLRHRGFLAWPNIAAGRLLVPERVGAITPTAIAAEAAEWLAQPQRLDGMRDDLRNLRGPSGAVARLADLIEALLPGSGPPQQARN
ncbi:MAG: glycosyl transferase [Synechococcus sp.]|nr:glycosyl transferase [Synechococcus sp.]